MKKKIIFGALLLLSLMVLVTGCTTQQEESTGQEAATESGTTEAEAAAATGDKTIDDSIAEILNNDDQYPDITAIDYNEDFTEFTITLESDTMNIYESMLVMSFYTFGDEKQVEAGVEDALTVVRYVNGSTGEIISESDSSSMVTE